jgi:hypothetical protein
MLRLLLVLLVLSTPAFSEESGPGKSKGEAEATQADRQHGQPAQPSSPSTSAPVINVYTSKHAGDEVHCAQPKDWKEWGSFAWCRSVEWIDAERTIAVFTVILGIATGFLWLATRNLVREAKETSKRELRAYISVTPVNVVSSDREERFVQIGLTVKNHGQTPAYRMNYVFGIDFLPNPVPEGFDYPNPTQPINHEASLFPLDSMSLWFNFNRLLTVEEFQQVENDRLRLHVWGKGFYSTVFDPGHHTNFVASVGGPEFVANLRAMRRKQKERPSFNWTWGVGHGSGN